MENFGVVDLIPEMVVLLSEGTTTPPNSNKVNSKGKDDDEMCKGMKNNGEEETMEWDFTR